MRKEMNEMLKDFLIGFLGAIPLTMLYVAFRVKKYGSFFTKEEFAKIKKESFEFVYFFTNLGSQSDLEGLNFIINKMNDLIKNLNSNKENKLSEFNDIYKKITNDKEKTYGEKITLKNENLSNLYKARKCIEILRSMSLEIKNKNSIRRNFKINKEINLIENKIKELNSAIKKITDNKPYKNIELIKLNFTEKNHIIPQGYFKKWVKSKDGNSINPFVLVKETDLDYKFNNNLIELENIGKLFHSPEKKTFFKTIKSFYEKKTKIPLNPINLKNFMSIDNCINQSLENLLTSIEYKGYKFNTEKIAFLDSLEHFVNNGSLDFLEEINIETVPSKISNNINVLNTEFEKKFPIEMLNNNLKLKERDFYNLHLFFVFLVARNEFAKHFCKAKISTQAHNDEKKYQMENVKFPSVQGLFMILNKLIKNNKTYSVTERTIKNISPYDKKKLKEDLKSYYNLDRIYYLKLIKKELKKILKNEKDNLITDKIKNLLKIQDIWLLKDKIEKFKLEIKSNKNENNFNWIEYFFTFFNEDAKWFDNDLMAEINSSYLRDLIINSHNEIKENYLIMTTKENLLTSCYPVVKLKVKEVNLTFIAYSPNILIINGNIKIVQEIIKRYGRDYLVEQYNNLIVSHNEFYIE